MQECNLDGIKWVVFGIYMLRQRKMRKRINMGTMVIKAGAEGRVCLTYVLNTAYSALEKVEYIRAVTVEV